MDQSPTSWQHGDSESVVSPELSPLFEIAPLPRTVDAALRDAASARVEVRKSTLRDLVRHVDGTSRVAVIGALRCLLREDPDTQVRALAAIACADAGAQELAPDLLAALGDGSVRVRQMALLALGELEVSVTESDWAIVTTFWSSELPALRYQALSTLFQLRPRQTVADLLSAIVDPDTEIRWLAWQLLDRWQTSLDAAEKTDVDGPAGVEPQPLVPSLRESARVRALRALAEREPARIKAEASVLLLRIGIANGFEFVRPLLDSPRGLATGQIDRIVLALGESRNQESVPWLRRQARLGWFEGRLAWVSTLALATMGDEVARTTIVTQLRSSSARSRCRALEAVRNLRLTEAEGVVASLAQSGAPGLSAAEARAVLVELRASQ